MATGEPTSSRCSPSRLSIPTSITFYRGGVIVQNGTETLYLKDHRRR